jgi:hypothetical protein
MVRHVEAEPAPVVAEKKPIYAPRPQPMEEEDEMPIRQPTRHTISEDSDELEIPAFIRKKIK